MFAGAAVHYSANSKLLTALAKATQWAYSSPFSYSVHLAQKKGAEIEGELDYNISQRDAEPRKRTPLNLTADRVGLLNDKRMNAHICPCGCALKSVERLKYWSFVIMNTELV